MRKIYALVDVVISSYPEHSTVLTLETAAFHQRRRTTIKNTIRTETTDARLHKMILNRVWVKMSDMTSLVERFFFVFLCLLSYFSPSARTVVSV